MGRSCSVSCVTSASSPKQRPASDASFLSHIQCITTTLTSFSFPPLHLLFPRRPIRSRRRLKRPTQSQPTLTIPHSSSLPPSSLLLHTLLLSPLSHSPPLRLSLLVLEITLLFFPLLASLALLSLAFITLPSREHTRQPPLFVTSQQTCH